MNAFYRINLEVETVRERPPLWPAQSGDLVIFLFADDPVNAASCARQIAELLPYIVTESKCPVYALDEPAGIQALDNKPRTEDSDAIDEVKQILSDMATNARFTGLGLAFVSGSTVKQCETRIIRFVEPTR
jgi:hypothetical protein